MNKIRYLGRMNPPCTPPLTITNCPDFWERLSAAPARFLGLDYDGTLAPFHVDPMQARPLPGVLEILPALINHSATSVAIISGRPAAEVARLLAYPAVTIVGSHGFELWRPGNETPRIIQPAAAQRAGLDLAKACALGLGYGDKLESKVASLAMHTRGLPPDVARARHEALAVAWGEIASRHELECRPFNGGVEIRCQGRHKGDAVNELLRAEPPGTLPVYVGDDDTDEDAFRAIRQTGIGIKVGAPADATAARGFLPDVEAVKRFLASWVALFARTG